MTSVSKFRAWHKTRQFMINVLHMNFNPKTNDWDIGGHDEQVDTLSGINAEDSRELYSW